MIAENPSPANRRKTSKPHRSVKRQCAKVLRHRRTRISAFPALHYCIDTAQLFPWGRGAPPRKNHRPGPGRHRRQPSRTAKPSSSAIRTSASPGANSIAKPPASPADSPASASRPATAPAYGPATASSGSSCSTRAARAGVVLVNVNPAYRSHELRYVLQKSRIRALFLREHDARANYRAILDDSRNGDALPLEHVIWLGEPSWDAMLAGGRDFARDTATPARRRQHSVHLRHHRLAQGRAAHPPQPGQQRHGDFARPARHRAGSHLRARAALPLLRLGDRLHGVAWSPAPR